jgi:MFS family permease
MFARLWAAGWVTAVGSQLTAVAVPLEIYGFSGSSAYVGLASLVGLVPMVTAALWGGAIADAADRRQMLLVTTAGVGVTSVLLSPERSFSFIFRSFTSRRPAAWPA